FRSREHIYMKRSQLDAAREDGIILNLHGSYNTTHHDARKYFDGLDSLNTSDFDTCNRSVVSWLPSADELEDYINWTGDTDGVTQDADGTNTIWCPDGHFWIAPACRHNVTSCIATVTFSGSLLLSMMHWSAFHGLPLALGSYVDVYDFFAKMKEGKTLFYWWEPENYRFDVDKVPLLLPMYNASEWAKEKRRFALDIRMLEELNQRLAEGGISPGDGPGEGTAVIHRAACDWVRSSESLWRTWIPTTCDAGSGLADVGGQFLLSRGDDAVGCSVCSSGRFSEPLLDSEGFTYRCATCPPGTSQEFANQISCNHCALGRVANQAGATECDLCPLGTFADQEGRAICDSCGDDTWTTKELVASDQ
ncbi:unnamed protein product, partial [Symbiodinium sp. CCMP2456]